MNQAHIINCNSINYPIFTNRIMSLKSYMADKV